MYQKIEACRENRKCEFSHSAVIDALVVNPRLRLKDLSQMFGYSEGWLSVVLSSDTFRVALRQRKIEVLDPTMLATLEDHYKALAMRSVAILQEKLKGPAEGISDELALKAADLGASMFKPTIAAPPAPVESSIDRLADRLIALQQGFRGTTLTTGETVDVTPA